MSDHSHSHAATDPFRHDALFYAGDDDFLAATVPFIQDGLRRDEPVLVAVLEPKRLLLRDALGATDAGSVAFAAMEVLGRNPGRIIPAWRDFVLAASVRSSSAATATCRGIGEPIWSDREADELVECQHHEALLNVAFRDAAGFNLLCPYNVTELDRDVLITAAETHPGIVDRDGSRASPGFRAGALDSIGADVLGDELTPAPQNAQVRTIDGATLHELRQVVAACASDWGLSPARTADLQLAVSELGANSVLHARGGGTFRIWNDGTAAVCEMQDAGLIVDPLVGRARPHPEKITGRGLYLVHQLCDLVQVRSTDAGTVVRLRVAINAS